MLVQFSLDGALFALESRKRCFYSSLCRVTTPTGRRTENGEEEVRERTSSYKRHPKTDSGEGAAASHAC